MKVLVTDYAWPDLDIERTNLASVPATLVAAEGADEEELTRLAADVDGILTNWKRVSREVIANAPSCKAIVRYGVGVDNIDVSYATEVGIVVANVPSYCVEEVSDHALAMLLALARRLVFYDRAIKAGVYDLNACTPMYRISGKTLGILGFGNIGRALYRKAQALGLEIIVCDNATNSRTRDAGIEVVSFEELLRRSDYVSVHVPLTSRTCRIFNLQTFRMMKPSAFLINTARGEIVDADSLIVALDDGVIAGAALDVLPTEPPSQDDALTLHPKVIATPHAAFNSEEAVYELRDSAASAMAALLTGQLPEHIVDPGVLTSKRLRIELRPDATSQSA